MRADRLVDALLRAGPQRRPGARRVGPAGAGRPGRAGAGRGGRGRGRGVGARAGGVHRDPAGPGRGRPRSCWSGWSATWWRTPCGTTWTAGWVTVRTGTDPGAGAWLAVLEHRRRPCRPTRSRSCSSRSAAVAPRGPAPAAPGSGCPSCGPSPPRTAAPCSAAARLRGRPGGRPSGCPPPQPRPCAGLRTGRAGTGTMAAVPAPSGARRRTRSDAPAAKQPSARAAGHGLGAQADDRGGAARGRPSWSAWCRASHRRPPGTAAARCRPSVRTPVSVGTLLVVVDGGVFRFDSLAKTVGPGAAAARG